MSDISHLVAVPPFVVDEFGIRDSQGDWVITCDDEVPPCTLYKADYVDRDGHFVCPKCGRLGQRMDEATRLQVADQAKEAKP